MAELRSLIAAHPIQKTPYNSIKFVRIDGCGTLLYQVGKDPRLTGAAEALRTAFERYGGHCFHCGQWMPAQPLGPRCTRDHIRPKVQGGGNDLHNLVLACGPCNRKKGGNDLISFSSDKGKEYMKALEAHIARCLAALGSG